MSHQRPTSPVRLWLVVVLVLAIAGALATGVTRRLARPALGAADLMPRGWWRLDMEGARPPDRAEELARVLSLPYVSGREKAGDRSGVLRLDRERAQPGVNLWVSGHGPEAILMDMEGKVLHRWRYAFERAFPGKRPTVETTYFRRAELLPGGELLVIYQGGGMVKLDRESRLLWAYDAGFYNDLFVTREGMILSIGKRAATIPEINRNRPVLVDSVIALSPEGELQWELPLLPLFQRGPYESLLTGMKSSGDIFHTNTVEPITPEAAAGSPLFRPGQLVVSLRELDIVAVIERQTEEVVWAANSPWKRQHQPQLLPGGRLLLFDNQGNQGRSRALEIDPLEGEIFWQYPEPGGRTLSSQQAGSVQRLENGNTLIVESERGLALEVTPGGEVVWEFANPHRAGREGELVACLFDLVRLPADLF